VARVISVPGLATATFARPGMIAGWRTSPVGWPTTLSYRASRPSSIRDGSTVLRTNGRTSNPPALPTNPWSVGRVPVFLAFSRPLKLVPGVAVLASLIWLPSRRKKPKLFDRL
jgi:hypothetical protein